MVFGICDKNNIAKEWSANKKADELCHLLYYSGRVDWIRTSDPLTPSQVRYQTAPPPVTYARLSTGNNLPFITNAFKQNFTASQNFSCFMLATICLQHKVREYVRFINAAFLSG